MYNYAKRMVFPIHTYITIFAQYCCVFGTILIVPLDVSITVIGRRSESGNSYYDSSKSAILDTYLTLYWFTLILSNVILVFQEQYNCNGFFTILTKVRNTCKNLSIQFLACFVLLSIFFGILVGSGTINASTDAILLTSILLTNTMWSTFIMFLLGYGLIMYPISVWNKSDISSRLIKKQYNAAVEFEKLTKAYSDIFLCISDIKRTKRELENNPEGNELLIKTIKILINNCPIELPSMDIGNIIIKKNIKKTTLGSLANYHQKLYWDTAIFTTSQEKLNSLQMKAYFLDDLVNASHSTKTINWSFKPESTHREYTWYLHVKPILYKLLAIFCGVLSMCTYFSAISNIDRVPKNLSPYFVIVHNNEISSIQLSFFVLVTIGYVCYVTVWSLFEMKLSKVMELVHNNSTWPIPMSINTRILGCLSNPLVFFYLGCIRENRILGGGFENGHDGTKIYSIFSEFYKIKSIPIIGDSNNVFFPALLVCVSALVMFNYLNKTLILFHCSGLQFGQGTMDSVVLEKGKMKLRERKKLIKKAYMEALNRANTKNTKTFFSGFLSGFTKQNKFNDYWVLNGVDEESSIESDEYNSIMSPIKTLEIPKLTRKIGLFINAFGKYSTVNVIQD